MNIAIIRVPDHWLCAKVYILNLCKISTSIHLCKMKKRATGRMVPVGKTLVKKSVQPVLDSL